MAFFSSKSDIVLGGRKAEYRIADKQPQFYSYFSPTEALLVKLKPGDKKDDRNLKMSSGGFHPYGGSTRQGVRSEDPPRSRLRGKRTARPTPEPRADISPPARAVSTRHRNPPSSQRHAACAP